MWINSIIAISEHLPDYRTLSLCFATHSQLSLLGEFVEFFLELEDDGAEFFDEEVLFLLSYMGCTMV